MKRTLLSFAFLIAVITAYSQTPQAFNYQGVARDLSGAPIAGQNIAIQVAILEGSTTGAEVFKEVHTITTSNLGLFNVEIGNGLAINGALSDIDWGGDRHYLQIEMDENGGSNFSFVGTSPLLSVPYALYAANGSKWENTNSGIKYDEAFVSIGPERGEGLLEINAEEGLPILDNSEIMINTRVAGNDLDYFAVKNGTFVDDQYIPTLHGHHGSDERMALFITGSITRNNDVFISDHPIMEFRSRLNDNGAGGFIENRNLFAWSNYSQTMMVLGAEGNLGLGTTRPINRFELHLKNDGNQLNKGMEVIRNEGFLRIANGTHLSGDFQPKITGRADSDLFPGLTLVGTPSLVGENSSGVVIRGGDTREMEQGNILEVDNHTTTHMVISAEGRLGIGTTQPNSKLQVSNGDVFIEDINSGVIMRSPNGQCWRYTPDNSGQLVSASIPCPN